MFNYINVILIELLTKKRWSIILIKLLTTKSVSIILNELIGKYKHIKSYLSTVTAYNINWIADCQKQWVKQNVCQDYIKYYILKIQIEVWTFQIWTHADRWRSCEDNLLKSISWKENPTLYTENSNWILNIPNLNARG